MRHHPQYVNLLVWVDHPCYQPVFIPTDIKDDAIADQTRRGESCSDIRPIRPSDAAVTDVGIPCRKGAGSILMPGALPKKPRKRDLEMTRTALPLKLLIG